jgi:hypothetical protein
VNRSARKAIVGVDLPDRHPIGTVKLEMLATDANKVEAPFWPNISSKLRELIGIFLQVLTYRAHPITIASVNEMDIGELKFTFWSFEILQEDDLIKNK